jgi:hypothetical protein
LFQLRFRTHGVVDDPTDGEFADFNFDDPRTCDHYDDRCTDHHDDRTPRTADR